MSSFEYIFPYEEIPKDARIAIYGTNFVGMEYYKQLKATNYCQVIVMFDKNYKQYADFDIPVEPIENKYKYDIEYIVIAARTGTVAERLIELACEGGTKRNKIIHKMHRIDESCSSSNNNGISEQKNIQLEPKSIAFFVHGAIGDLLCGKKVVDVIQQMFRGVQCDIYKDGDISFLKYVYSEDANVRVYENLGLYFQERKEKYGLAIEIQAMRYIKVQKFDSTVFEDEFPKAVEQIRKLIIETDKEDANISTSVYLLMQRRNYVNKNVYTAFSYNGALPIYDYKVKMPMPRYDFDEWKDIKNWNYITINTGNAHSDENTRISKEWPIEYYEELVAKIRKRFPTLKIIQLGSEYTAKLQDCDKYFFGHPFETATALLNSSILHIDIEGGLVHIASQLGTKCAVIFGATSVEYVGYPNNINIYTDKCNWCYGIYPDIYKCARELEKPECMWSVKPDMVLERIKPFLESTDM